MGDRNKVHRARQLFTEAESNKGRRLERLVEDLRHEFDTLHRVCMLLLGDLEDIDQKLSTYVTKDICTMVTLELETRAKQVHELTQSLEKQDMKLRQLESELRALKVPSIVITNTGAAVGRDVSGNVDIGE